MYCPNCGKEIGDDFSFCMNCGHAFTGKTPLKREKSFRRPWSFACKLALVLGPIWGGLAFVFYVISGDVKEGMRVLSISFILPLIILFFYFFRAILNL